jgi:hypothetical protein
MVTVQQIYDMAIHLMDEQTESNGATVSADTAEYKYRTISILNTAIPMLYPYSGTFTLGKGARPNCRKLEAEDFANPDFEQTIPLDDALALCCLPYYLASVLVSSENDSLSMLFMNQYRMAVSELKSKLPGEFTQISTPYGAF